MRASEFITEAAAAGRTGTITRDVGLALPGAFKIPQLQNNDPYKQYRFGVAIAGAKGASQRAKDGVPDFDGPSSTFGEDMVIVSYDPHVKDYIDDALRAMHMPASDAVQIGTMASEEAPDVAKTSPVKGFAGYPR
jgi:hypothetical protein